MKRSVLLSVWVALLLSLSTAQARDTGDLVVFAAASLTDAFEAIGTAFEEAHPGAEVLFNFAGSSTLAAQLVQGAPADVFASANDTQMNAAVTAERIAEPIRTFAKNRLVLIVPADNPAGIQSLRDLTQPGMNLILAAPGVPVRAYTDMMLERATHDSASGAGYRTAVLDNLVSEEPNVRQVAAKIALGEADAGIVYASDITPDIADEVMTISIPSAFNTIATYPIAVTDDTEHPELANRFIEFVLSDAGQDILVAWDFISVRPLDLPDTIMVPTDDTLQIAGHVLTPLSLRADRLRSDFNENTIDVSYRSGAEIVETSFTGVLLWDVVNAAQPHPNAAHDDQLTMFIVATGAGGDQAVIAWGEIDPVHGNQPVLIAYTENGRPLADLRSGLRLVVPSDGSDGRHVRGLAHISLREAPPPAGR